MSESRRFWLRTYGCQMNVHDSEKVANLLCHHGYTASEDPDRADLWIVNTCSIRDKAEQRLSATSAGCGPGRPPLRAGPWAWAAAWSSRRATP